MAGLLWAKVRLPVLAAGSLFLSVSALATTSADAATVQVSAAAHGPDPALFGYQLVPYRQTGTITGKVNGGASGTKVELRSDVFPFTEGFSHPVRGVTSAGGIFSFTVSPVLATEYQVALSASPSVHSSTVELFVFQGDTKFKFTYSAGCSASAPTKCTFTAGDEALFPTSVAKARVAKHEYIYFGLNLVPRAKADVPPPTTLKLDPNARIVYTPTSVPGTYDEKFSGSYSVPASYRSSGWSSRWVGEWCAPETFTQDGFGLPFHYGCGKTSVANKTVDLDSLG